MISLNSPPSSPLVSRTASSGNGPRSPLRLPDVANLIVKLRRSSSKAKLSAAAQGQAGVPLECTSGNAPQTHPCLLGEGVTLPRRVPLIEQRRLLCQGGVDTKRLLRTLRATLLEEAQMIGATVLVDEQWTCYIHPANRHGVYKVDIRYTACAARSNTADPQQPIALEQARGMPGLMTVVG